MQAKAKEERDYIAELNERIFKLHKALKERLSEERKLAKSSNDSSEMTLEGHLEDVVTLAMNILTDNTVSYE
jgi:hypothetical protein